MNIRWHEDQPFMRPVKEQIVQSGLIRDLAELVNAHNFSRVEAMLKKFNPCGGRDWFYECSVFQYDVLPSHKYYGVLIGQSGHGTRTDFGARGEIRKADVSTPALKSGGLEAIEIEWDAAAKKMTPSIRKAAKIVVPLLHHLAVEYGLCKAEAQKGREEGPSGPPTHTQSFTLGTNVEMNHYLVFVEQKDGLFASGKIPKRGQR